MKISDKKAAELLEQMSYYGDEVYGTSEVVDDIASAILKSFKFDRYFPDEISVTDGDSDISLQDFIEKFWDKAMEAALNFIRSE